MKKYLSPIALAIPLALTACGLFGFQNEQHKQEAWEAYNCQSYRDLSAQPEQIQIHLDILWDNIPMDEIPEANRWARKLEKADTVADVMEYTDTEYVTNMCDGWLWEWHKKDPSFKEGYEEFTYDTAVDAGVISG